MAAISPTEKSHGFLYEIRRQDEPETQGYLFGTFEKVDAKTADFSEQVISALVLCK